MQNIKVAAPVGVHLTLPLYRNIMTSILDFIMKSSKLFDTSSSLSALMMFATFTLLHVLIVISHRTLLINTGRAKPNAFISMRKDSEATFIGRVGCAHANCVENLTLFAVVVLVNALMGVGAPSISKQAWWYVSSRVAQSLTHWYSVSDTAVTVRFICFFTSIILLINMGYKTVSY